MQAGYSYDRNIDKKFLKAKLKVRKLDKQTLGLYDSINSDQISATVTGDTPKSKTTGDMNTQTDLDGADTSVYSTSIGDAIRYANASSQVSQSDAQRRILNAALAQQMAQRSNEQVASTIMRGVNDPRFVSSDVTSRKSEPIKSNVDPVQARQMQLASVLSGDVRKAMSAISSGAKPSDLKKKKAQETASNKSSSEVINNVPTVQSVAVPSNVNVPILRAPVDLEEGKSEFPSGLPPLTTGASPKGSIASLEEFKDANTGSLPTSPEAKPGFFSNLVSSIVNEVKAKPRPTSPTSTIATDATTDAMTSMAQTDGQDIGNLEDTKMTPGRKGKYYDTDEKKQLADYLKLKNDATTEEKKKIFKESVNAMITALPEIQQLFKTTGTTKINVNNAFKPEKTAKINNNFDIPVKYQVVPDKSTKKPSYLVTTMDEATKYLDNRAASLGVTAGTGIKKPRIGLAARRPRKGESLPMNSILMNQLDKGHLNLITKKGNQILKQKNISAPFKRIVNDVMKTGSFEADDYKMIDDKEIPIVNQFIIQTDAAIPPDTPYKSTADHVKDVKARYAVLVGELASGNSGRIIRDEMKSILKEMWRLRQITFKAYKERTKGLDEFA